MHVIPLNRPETNSKPSAKLQIIQIDSTSRLGQRESKRRCQIQFVLAILEERSNPDDAQKYVS